MIYQCYNSAYLCNKSTYSKVYKIHCFYPIFFVQNIESYANIKKVLATPT